MSDYLKKNTAAYKSAAQRSIYIALILFAFPLAVYFTYRNQEEFTLLDFVIVVLAYLAVVATFFAGRKYFISDRKANEFASGLSGEVKAKKSFDQLKQLGFEVFYDMQLDGKRGNIDFIIVGQNGVFAIEIKNHKGRVTNDYGNLMLSGSNSNYLHEQARREAFQLKNHIKNKLSREVYVQSLLIFTRAKMPQRLSMNNVTITTLYDAISFIKNKKGYLDNKDQIVNLLKHDQVLQQTLVKNQLM